MIGRQLRLERLRNELDRIINKIDKSQVKKIILFGSLVNGRVGLTSDIDLIVVRNTKERFLDRLESIYKEVEPDMAVDILVYTPQEIREMKSWNSFVMRALKEGKVLYEA